MQTRGSGSVSGGEVKGGQRGILMPREGEKERRRFEKKKRRFQQKEKREKTDYSDEYAKRCIN